MKTGTAVALGVGGLVSLLAVGGLSFLLIKKMGGESAENTAVKLAQIEQQKVAGEGSVKIAQAQAEAAKAAAAADVAKTQAKALDKEWWEIGAVEISKGIGSFIGGGDFLSW